MLVYRWCTWKYGSPFFLRHCPEQGDAKKRYQEKISVLNGVDPFLAGLGEPVEAVPPVDASDLLSYLVLQTNYITAKQFKAYKSLEAYNQFVCGWIKDVRTWRVAGKFVITGQVRLVSRFCSTPTSLFSLLFLIGLSFSTDEWDPIELLDYHRRSWGSLQCAV